MKEFLITLFLGEFGVHRFMKKQYLIGVIYLCTLGVFGIGWLIDTVIALSKVVKGETTGNDEQKAKKSENFGEGGTNGKQLIKSFDTVIVGTFANSSKYPDEQREDAIKALRKGQELELEFWKYKGDPAYYVCDLNGVDVGNIRAGLAKILYEEYRECTFNVTAIELTMDDRNDCVTFNIRIDIYR